MWSELADFFWNIFKSYCAWCCGWNWRARNHFVNFDFCRIDLKSLQKQENLIEHLKPNAIRAPLESLWQKVHGIGLMIQIKTDRTDNWPCWASISAFIIQPVLIYEELARARTDGKWLMAWWWWWIRKWCKDQCHKMNSLLYSKHKGLTQATKIQTKERFKTKKKESLRRGSRWQGWNWWSMIEVPAGPYL